MYKRNTAADRTTVLRKIAFFYGLFAFLIWGNVTWSYFDDSGDIWQQIPRTSTALYLGLGATVCLAFVIWGLWTAKRWAWGAALACLAIPVFGAVIIAYGKLMAGMSFILWYYFFYYCVPALHEAAPKTTFIPESMMNDIDCIAAELGVRWQDHFLYHCLELVYAKGPSAASSMYRQQFHVTWDEADKAIGVWIGKEEELKIHILKEHVQAMKSRPEPRTNELAAADKMVIV